MRKRVAMKFESN